MQPSSHARSDSFASSGVSVGASRLPRRTPAPDAVSAASTASTCSASSINCAGDCSCARTLTDRLPLSSRSIRAATTPLPARLSSGRRRRRRQRGLQVEPRRPPPCPVRQAPPSRRVERSSVVRRTEQIQLDRLRVGWVHDRLLDFGRETASLHADRKPPKEKQKPPSVADSHGQQIRKRLERRQIDMWPLPSTNDRAILPVEHPQRHFDQRTWRATGQPTAGYGNAVLGKRTINGNLLPRPWVKLVENPAFSGTVGVRESSCTTTCARTRRWTAARRATSTGAPGRGRVSPRRFANAGNATAVAASNRYAAPPLRSGPSGVPWRRC